MGDNAAADVPPDSDRASRFLTGLWELLKAPGLPTVLGAIAASARLCAQSDIAAVFIENGSSYCCVAISDHAGVRSVEHADALPESSPPLHALRSGLSSYLVHDTLSDASGMNQMPVGADGEQARTWLALALRVEERLLGFIGVSFLEVAEISDTDCQWLEQFAFAAASLLRQANLFVENAAVAVRDERDRLAREIHDVLAQTITGLVMQLDALAAAVPADSPMFDRLEQTRGMGRAAAAETRRLVWNLRPASVDLTLPRVVVKEEAGRFARRASLIPQVDVVGEDRPIASEIGAVIQRLMQVALENVTRHSDANQVHILLHFGLHGLSLQIEDDGEGFDPEAISRSAGRLGLASVTERARQVGGTLRIESAAGHGTRVQLELPFHPAPPIPRARISEAQQSQPSQEPRLDVSSPTTIRIVLIDDHAMVREGLTRMLSEQADFRVLEAVSTGADGLRAIAELRPDVVLCDLQLPDIPGTEVIARARAHFPDIRCLVVTTFDDDENIYEAIKSGAKGYVLKDASADDLVDAVRAVARNESLLQPVVAHKLVQRLGALARQGDMVETLTEREIEVLRALAGGLRNKEIAFQLGLSESTIKTHLASIFGKLGVTTRTEAVGRGRELGLIPL